MNDISWADPRISVESFHLLNNGEFHYENLAEKITGLLLLNSKKLKKRNLHFFFLFGNGMIRESFRYTFLI